jgi:protein-S-isoprenylcysteine O-methyltransferase Ste14
MRYGLGSEHPLCDRIQLIMLVLFFLLWGLDFLSFSIFGYSSVIFQASNFPLIFSITLLFWGLSIYLISNSHKAVLKQVQDPPKLVGSGVYSWIRHPMYLGTLLFCLSFLFINFSLVSFALWIIFFIFYDRIATYEERNLIEILGDGYITYQKRVSKWVPMVW